MEEGDHVSLLNVFRAFIKVGIERAGMCAAAVGYLILTCKINNRWETEHAFLKFNLCPVIITSCSDVLSQLVTYC